MATTILAASQRIQYRLPEADRQQILATMPADITFPDGIVPDALLLQNSHIFPKLTGRTKLSIGEMNRIMRDEVALQQADFLKIHDGIFG